MSLKSKFMEMNYREITCQRQIGNGNFSQGVQDFNWAVGHPVSWIPSCTYLRMSMSILGSTGAQPNDGDQIAFAENCANNLYNNVYLRVGQQDLSSNVQFVPQASMLKQRYGTPGALMNSVKKSVGQMDASFLDRLGQISSDGDLYPLDPSLFRTANRNTIDVVFQPGALGIWDYNDIMPSGEYRLSLNPNSELLNAAQGNPGTSVGGTFSAGSPQAAQITISDVKLYLCTVKVTESVPRSLFRFELAEIFIASKPIASIGQNLEFQVPASTVSLAFFLQDGSAGVPTANVPNKISLSGFKLKNNEDLNVTGYQLTYANQTKPSTNFTTGYTSGVNNNSDTYQTRYFSNLVENDLYRNDGGAESLEEYLTRGPFYMHSFIRDKDDKSTQVQVQLNLSAVTVDNTHTPQLFLAAIYNRATEVGTENGRITYVRALNT